MFIDSTIKSENECESKADFLNTLINLIKKAIANKETDNAALGRLQANVEQFTLKVNKHILECRDGIVLDFTNVKNQNFVATFNYNNYEKYVKNTYGVLPSGDLEKNTVELIRVNFYSSAWVKKYGSPFEDVPYGFQGFGNNDIINLPNIDINLVPINNLPSFSCSVTGGSRQGKINKISKNEIFVASEGINYILKVGDCSLLETSTGNDIPEIGNTIYWKGSETGQNSYNVHSGLCT